MLGPTASGKTKLACELAFEMNGEIISADSRQVYKHLNIGTGKDLEEYIIRGRRIAFHLIDIAEPGVQYFLYQFAEDLERVFLEVRSRNRIPIVCGGTGLYLDALRKDFSFTRVKEDPALRSELEKYTRPQLIDRLNSYPVEWTEHVDRNSAKRLVRGIEIAEERIRTNPDLTRKKLPYRPFYVGISTDAEQRKKRISERLLLRLNSGMIEEVQSLIINGISPQRLEFLGLEYKFIALFLRGELSREQMITKLEAAIFQFAKRQMTWFRRMEKEGVKIHWISQGSDTMELVALLKDKGLA